MEVWTDVQVQMIFIQNLSRFDKLLVVGLLYKETHAIHFNAAINLSIKLIYMCFCTLAYINGFSTYHAYVLFHTIGFVSLQKGNSWDGRKGFTGAITRIVRSLSK